MNRLLSFLVVAILTVSADAETSYLVQSSIYVSGEKRAEPGMTVPDRQMGMVSLSENLELAIVASGVSEQQVLISSLLVVDGESHQPSMLLELGKRGSIQIGDKEISFLVTKFSKPHKSL